MKPDFSRIQNLTNHHLKSIRKILYEKTVVLSNTVKHLKKIKYNIRESFYNIVFKTIKKIKSKTVYHIYGFPRSGNHVIIHWIKCNINGSVLFFNDLKKGKHPRNCIIKQFKLQFGRPAIMISMEGYSLNDLTLKFDEEIYGKFDGNYEILILRDPFNLFASLFAWKFKLGRNFKENKDYREKIVAIWKDNAKTFIEWTKNKSPTQIPINYNKWCEDLNYRQKLLKSFELQSCELEINKIPNFGGGSSFSKLKKANDNIYSERFKHFENNVTYRNIFKDKEVLELSYEIFGKIEGTDRLYKTFN